MLPEVRHLQQQKGISRERSTSLFFDVASSATVQLIFIDGRMEPPELAVRCSLGPEPKFFAPGNTEILRRIGDNNSSIKGFNPKSPLRENIAQRKRPLAIYVETMVAPCVGDFSPYIMAIAILVIRPRDSRPVWDRFQQTKRKRCSHIFKRDDAGIGHNERSCTEWILRINRLPWIN